MYEETVGSSVGMAEFDMTRKHGTGFWVKFELTRITHLICLSLMYEKIVGSSVDLAKFDTTREHYMIFAGLG